MSKPQQQKQTTALVQDPKESFAQINDFLMTKRKMIGDIAGKHLNSEQMIRMALAASSRSPKLLLCTPKSWLLALLDSAYYGLEPNPILGHAYIIPYENKRLGVLEAQFQVGYKGIILLATEHGGFTDVEARPVYEGELEMDRFEETPEDPRKPFRHRPLYDSKDRGEVAGVYAIGWRGTNVRPRFQYLTIEEVNEYRKRSKSRDDGPWVTDYLAMARKTAVRRMLAMAQMRGGNKVGALLEQESAHDRGETAHAQEWKVDDEAPPVSRNDALADQLARQAAEPPPAEERGA